MARPAATADQREEQRNRIRHAAAELYREGGVSALSVRAVAKRAGVSTGLLYRYFADMSELMRSLWIGPVVEFGHEVEAIAAAEPDPLARIEALLTAYARWVGANPDVHRGVLLFVRPDSTGLPAPVDPDTLALHRALRTAVADGQATDRIRAGDPTELAQVLWAGMHGALALPVNFDRYAIAPPSDLAPAMIATLLASLEA